MTYINGYIVASVHGCAWSIIKTYLTLISIPKVFCNLLDFDHIYESFQWGGYAVADKLKNDGKQVG